MHQVKKYTRKLNWIKCAAVLFITILFAGCNIDGPRRDYAELKDFLREDDAGMLADGKYLFKYSQEDSQRSINKRRRHIRLQHDNQNSYVHIQLSSFPATLNETIEVFVISYTDEQEVSNSYTMDAAKFESGKVWLWDKKKHTGIILPVCW